VPYTTPVDANEVIASTGDCCRTWQHLARKIRDEQASC
jgi:hypothetical protein